MVDLGVAVTAHPSDAVTRCGFQDQVVVDDLDIFIERCHRADAEPAVLPERYPQRRRPLNWGRRYDTSRAREPYAKSASLITAGDELRPWPSRW